MGHACRAGHPGCTRPRSRPQESGAWPPQHPLQGPDADYLGPNGEESNTVPVHDHPTLEVARIRPDRWLATSIDPQSTQSNRL